MKSNTILMLFAIFFSLSQISCVKDKNKDGKIIVLSVIGHATLGDKKNELKLGIPIKIGNKIITLKNSMVELLINDSSAIKLYENTEFIVKKNTIYEGGKTSFI